MEQETRKFAIEQAIKLISSRPDITDKTKAVFDLADQIIKYVGTAQNNDFIPFTPVAPIYNPSPSTAPYWQPPYEVTCVSGVTDGVCDDGIQQGSVTYKTK